MIGTGELIASCGGGAEGALAAELDAIGLRDIRPGIGTVRFRGGTDELVRANLESRLASRILLPLTSGPAHSYDDLYRLCATLPWSEIVPPRSTLKVWAVCRSSALRDTRYAALKVKDAIVDNQRRHGGRRSEIARTQADVVVSVFAGNDGATISLDTTDQPLHVRGYRIEAGDAPLRETVAATLLSVAGWNGSRPLLDPFCGSGTIVIEAALLASQTAPGLMRSDFGFLRWPSFDTATYRKVRSEIESRKGRETEPPPAIVGTDIDPEAIDMAKRNAERAGVAHLIRFAVRDVAECELPGAGAIVITNPPYGERLKLEDAEGFYKTFGDTIKQRLPGADVWVFTANRDAMKRLGLRIASRHVLYNGGLESRLYNIPIRERN